MGWIVVLIVLLGSFAGAIQYVVLSFFSAQIVSDLGASVTEIGAICDPRHLVLRRGRFPQGR